jgi:RNA polymerase sigma factor (TIGR02999 family)
MTFPAAAAPAGPDAGFRPQALLDDCYAEMRRTARALLAGESDRVLIQPTDLAHEAAIRLLRLDTLEVKDRGHMLALAARVMRQALIDEARRAGAAKRQPPPMVTEWPGGHAAPIELDVLDDALRALAEVSAEHAQIVELRFSLGLTVEETAAVTGINARTVTRRWRASRTWLQSYLEAGGAIAVG